MSAVVAIQRIEAAGLTDKQYRAARRLLDRAIDTGHLKLVTESAMAVCMTTSEGSMRRLLGQLKSADIINYHINGCVYIDFKSWSASDHPRAESARPRANSDHEDYYSRSESDHPRANSDHPRAESARGRANSDHEDPATYTHVRAGVGRLVGIIPTIEDLDPTYQPTPTEIALSLRLLLHIRLMKRNAERLAQTHPFERIREAVAHWWENRGDLFGEQPGIIVRWLDNWEESGVPALSTEFKRSDLYHEFRTPSELKQDAQREAELTQQYGETTVLEAPVVEEAAALDPLTELWSEILLGIKLATPNVFNDWLSDSQLTELTSTKAGIAVGKNKREWIESRLGKQLRRELAMRGHRPDEIIFQEVEHD